MAQAFCRNRASPAEKSRCKACLQRVKTGQKKERTLEGFSPGAENETRTRDPNLGKVMLYQLSYFRIFSLWWYPGRDLNPQGHNGHGILSPACLPIPPPRQNHFFKQLRSHKGYPCKPTAKVQQNATQNLFWEKFIFCFILPVFQSLEKTTTPKNPQKACQNAPGFRIFFPNTHKNRKKSAEYGKGI